MIIFLAFVLSAILSVAGLIVIGRTKFHISLKVLLSILSVVFIFNAVPFAVFSIYNQYVQIVPHQETDHHTVPTQ